MSKLYARITGPTLEETKHERAACMERIRRRQEIPSDQYPSLPWIMEELPGTTWRNAHTAHLVTVRCLGKNRFGKLGPDPGAASMFSIGLWRGERFCIEHWVRVDLLPAEEQIAWAKERVAICRAELHTAEIKLKKVRERGRSITFTKYQVQSQKEKLEEARQELRALCEEMGLGLRTSDVLNVGILPNEQFQML